MTIDTLLLMVVATYLVLVAYGVGGTGRRLTGRAKGLTIGLLVLLPPALLTVALAGTGEAMLVVQWWRLFAGMLVAGALVAVLAGRIAQAAAR